MADVEVLIRVNDNELESVKREIKELTRKKHEIKLELRDKDLQIEKLKRELESLEKRYKLDLDDKDLAEIDRLIADVKTKLDALKSEKYELDIKAKGDILDIDHKLEELKKRQEELANAERERKNAARETAEAYEEQVDAINKVAKALQTLGEISQLTDKFATSIGKSFSAMADVFNTNIFDVAKNELTRMATQTLVGDFGKITARYDIMSTFSDYMQLAGISADRAAESLQRVNDSILGLPIGLDESAQRLRRYQMFLGDLEKSTNLTIGLQKAIYAGGANEQARTQSFYQIDRLLTVGKLNTARQWNALLVGLGVSLRYIGEELGYTINDVSEFSGMLASGQISTEEFLGALMRLGEGGSDAASKLDNALGIYKGTLESWLSNIRFAAVRGGVTVLNALNDVMKDTTDVGIVGYMEKIRDSMNDLYKGIGSWITSNPEAFSKNFEAIERLIFAIDRFSASNIAAGIFDNLARGVDMLTYALRRLPTKDVEEFFAFATTLAGPLGEVFRAAASGAGTLIGVFNRFKDFDFESLISKIITQIELLAGAVEKLLRLISDSAMEDLLAFGLVWGKPAANVLGSLAKGTFGLAATLKLFATEGSAAAAVLAKLGAVAPYVAAGVAAVGLAFAGIVTAIAQAKRNVEEAKDKFGQKELDYIIGRAEHDIAELGNISVDIEVADKEKAVRDLREVVDEIKALDKAASEKRVVHVESEQAGKPVPSSGEYTQMRDLVNDVNLAYPDAKLRIDPRTRTLDERSRQVLDVIMAQEEYNLALETSVAAEKELEKAEENRNNLLEDRERLTEKVQEKEDALADAQKKLNDAYLNRGPGRGGLRTEVEALKQQRDEAQAELDRVNAAIRNSEGKSLTLFRKADRASAQAASIERSDIAQTEWWSQLGPARAEVENLIKAYKDLGPTAQESIEKQLEGFGKLKKEASKTREDIENSLNTEKEVLDRYLDSAKEVERYALETGDERLQEALDEASQMGLNEGGAWIAGWNKAIQEAQSSKEGAERLEGLLKLYDENRDKAEMAQQASSFISAAKEHFEEALDMNKDDLKALGSAWLNAVFGDLTPSDMVKALSGAMEGSDELFSVDSEGSLAAGVAGVKTSIEEINTKTLPEMVTAMQQTSTDSITAIQNITKAVEELIKTIERLIAKLSALRLEMYKVETTMTQGFARIVQSVQEAINKVQELIDKLRELKEFDGMTVNVNINGMEGGEGEGEGEGEGTPGATGGLFTKPGAKPKYYAKGGWVFMKPKGTDTVPAMLTPGEYVMRKKAVDRLGVPFLRSLNRLDIGSAFDSLMSRVYRPNLSSMAAYSYYNTSNDNRAYSVTQHISTNNPDYSYRIANRFAHAL